jgi:hypothetical protein
LIADCPDFGLRIADFGLERQSEWRRAVRVLAMEGCGPPWRDIVVNNQNKGNHLPGKVQADNIVNRVWARDCAMSVVSDQ